MKRLFLLALSSLSLNAMAAIPVAHVLERLETAAAYGRPALVQEKDGSRTIVQLEDLTGDKYNLRLAAYGKGGKVILETKAMRPQSGENLMIASAARNEIGDLVVVTYYSRNTATSGVIYSDNLTTKASARLAEGSFPSLLDRMRVGGKNIALISTDLGHGPDNTYPVLLRVVNEDDASVLKQIVLDQGVSAKMGLNSRGEPVALLFGYEIFGLLDLTSGQLKELVERRRQPSEYPAQIHLAIGDFMALTEGDTMRLLDQHALLDGELKVVRSFARNTAFLGGAVPTIAAEHKEDEILISDIATGKVLGPAIPAGAGGRSQRSLVSVTDTPAGLIALVSELKVPNSFLPGTILTYIKVATGEIIRRAESAKNYLSGQVVVQNGRVLSLETGSSFPKNTHELIDVLNNKKISAGGDLLMVAGIQTESGHILGLKANGQKQVCLVDLENEADATCLNDPLLLPDGLHYGYQPLNLSKGSGEITLPLTSPAGDKRLVYRGFIRIKVE